MLTIDRTPREGVAPNQVLGLQGCDDRDTGKAGLELAPADALAAARSRLAAGELREAVHLAFAAIDISTSYRDWHVAASIVARARAAGHGPEVRRQVRAWLASSWTVVQFSPLLELAALRMGVGLDLLVGSYGQIEQDILNPHSPLYAAEPDYVVLAAHAGDLLLPSFTDDPEATVSATLERWTTLWNALARHGRSRIVMHNFALPPETAFGHLGTRLPGVGQRTMAELNRRLGETAGRNVVLVDVDRLSALVGKSHWFSRRYWHLSKQAFAPDSLPTLALHTAAVMAGDLGLGKKCIAVDLDNTLWGGIVGEDGVAGLRIGPEDPEGEAFQSFQRYLKALGERGVILAVCSKNNPDDAREVFEMRNEMVLGLEDFAAFEANWNDKATNLRRIAEALGIGLDAIVFLDDNPAERELVRQLAPEVEVLRLPPDPAEYVTAVASAPLFELPAFTAEDRARGRLYRSRATFASLSRQAASLEDFLGSLNMMASAEPLSGGTVERVAQLLGKSNQFNLTTRRYGADQLTALAGDPCYVLLACKLRDRLADHGLVGVIGGRCDEALVEIDVFAMSCRVIGRTMETFMLDALVEASRRRLCTTMRGVYIPTPKNMMVRDLYPKLGFEQVADGGPQSVFTLSLASWRPSTSFIAELPDPTTRDRLPESIDVA